MSIEKPSGLVRRKRRLAVELVSTNTGSVLPSGSVRVSCRYCPPDVGPGDEVVAVSCGRRRPPPTLEG